MTQLGRKFVDGGKDFRLSSGNRSFAYRYHVTSPQPDYREVCAVATWLLIKTRKKKDRIVGAPT